MKKLHFKMNQEQYNTLCGLAYRIADNAYMIERYGRENCAIELKQNHDTIIGIFDSLDSLRVPFWVQNVIIVWAETWRNLKKTDIREAYKERYDVDFSGVSCI